MESEAHSYCLSDAAASSRSSQLKSPSHFYLDFEEVDGDDDLSSEYPCPFCGEDFDLDELCCHMNDEHPMEANVGICPVCCRRVGPYVVEHITMQHGDIFNSQHRLKFQKDDVHRTQFFERKELQEDHVLVSGISSVLSTPKMAPDPLLSFLYNPPVIEESKTVQPAPLSKVNLKEKNSDDTLSERDVHLNPIADMNQEEKTRRCEFVEGLVLSTFFGDGL